MKRWIFDLIGVIKTRLIAPALFLLMIFTLLFIIIPPDKKSLYPNFSSFVVYDRNGIPLRQVLSMDYKTSVWESIKDIDINIIKTTIMYEDKRFFQHNGVDLIALFRALYENIRYHRVVSGGSTITMQVAKIMLSHKKRTIFNKILEILYALKLELHLNKAEILEVYLNRVPYGNQIYGVEAAAQFYFAKSANQLSLGESCILCALPKSPNILGSHKNPDKWINEKTNILNKLLKEKTVDSIDYFCAIKEPFQINEKRIIFKAPHFVDFLLANKKDSYSTITSTIDYNLQEKLEKMLITSINSLRKYNVNQGALIVMDTKTGEILVMVGSKDYFEKKEGQVNGCISLRQPGSSLKPFLYILALHNGLPMSYLMNDTITEFKLSDGTYFVPRNYGNKYHRLVRAREALGSSFNIPAVHLLDKVGIENFYTFLKNIHFTDLFQKPNVYGLSLSLGAAEVKLIELVNAYRAIANKGMWTEYKFIKSRKTNKIGEMVFSEEAAYIITSVLSDNSSRIKAFGDDSPLNLPFPCAVKTGTTKNFKDNWCIGFTENYTVGVWVGNFDGSPMNGVSGISGAAPLFRDIMIELHKDEYPKGFEEPKSLKHLKVCARTGLIAGNKCPAIEEIFIPGSEPKDTCKYCVGAELVNVNNGGIREISISHPHNGDIFKLDPQIPYKNQAISFRVRADTKINKIILKLNGMLLYEENNREVVYLWQPKPGIYELEAIGFDAHKMTSDKITFTVY